MSDPGWGAPSAAWLREQKKNATGAEKALTQDVRATNKATPVSAPGLEPWWTPIGIYQRVTGMGSIRKTKEEQRADPLSPWEKLIGALPEAGTLLKWGVVGIIAIVALVIVPRLMPK